MLNIIRTIILTIATIISMAYLIPAVIIYLAVLFVIPIIITFALMMRKALKNNNKRAIVYAILTHLFMIGVFIVFENRPETTDSITGLEGLGFGINMIFFSSFFAFLATICFIIYCASFSKKKKEIIDSPQVVGPVIQKKNCLHCGYQNDINNQVCSNCGMKL